MPTYIVNQGINQDNYPIITTVAADTFSTEDGFVIFKVGSVVVKAIRDWQVDSIELVNPPPSEET